MRDKWTALVLFCGLLCLAVLLICGERLSRADSAYRSAQQQRAHLTEQVQRFQQLTVQQADTIFGTQPRSDFEKRIGETIQASGLRPMPRYSVSVQADQDHRDPRGQPTGLREQRASMQMGGLEPVQIGQFLVLWRENQALWSPQRMSLTHDQRSKMDRYTLNMECVAVYHGEGSEN